MPYMPNKKSQQAFFTKKPVIIVLGLLLVGLAGWIFLVNPLLDQRDKDRFLHAQTELETILEEKIMPTAEPTHVEREQSCRYSGAKYEKGNLSCITTIEIVYAGVTEQEVYELVDNLSAQINSPLRDTTNRQSTQGDALANTTGLSQRIESQEEGGLTCSAQYSELSRFSHRSSVDYGDSTGLYMTMACTDSARAEHFPVE